VRGRYENTDGKGTFGPKQIITTNVYGASWSVAADLNGDGRIDVISTAYYGNEVAWYENTCMVGFNQTAGACIPCPAGTTTNQSTQCVPCQTGRFSSGTGGACVLCTEGRYAAGSASSCAACMAGTVSVLGASACLDCTMGKYSASSVCQDCESGKFANQNRTASCKLCQVGTYSSMPGLSTCTECAPGRFQSQISGSQCEECAAGRYQDTNGGVSCIPCPAGMYLEFAGATHAASCIVCEVGKKSGEGAQICSALSDIGALNTTELALIGAGSTLIGVAALCWCRRCRREKKRPTAEPYDASIMFS